MLIPCAWRGPVWGACMAVCIHLCVILWTEQSHTAASVGDGGHGVLKVPVSSPSVLWHSGVARVVLCLIEPETPYFFRCPVGMHEEELLLSSFLTQVICNI